MASSQDNRTCGVCYQDVTAGHGQAIFTAECSHSFHTSCLGTNLSDANNYCPTCGAQWTQLPPRVPFHQPYYNMKPFPFNPPPVLEPEPIIFSDDEPLPAANGNSGSSSSASLSTVKVKSIPERPAIASSESASQFAVLVGARAPPMLDNARNLDRAPVDLVTVLDVSGSMDGSKISLLKRAMLFVIENLGPADRLSIVSFSDHARRIFTLRRMTDQGRQDAKRAVNSLYASGSTNIVDALKKGVQVLEERRHKNPVASIIFLSDGCDTCHHNSFPTHSNKNKVPEYLNLLPSSIRRENGGKDQQQQTFPVHAFGFGSDHDPVVMHAISDGSGGTFSFIESYEMVQDAFASCIGGLLSVVTQDLQITVRAASHGVEIKSIPSGRYASNISDQGSKGVINVGDLYADEEKDFLVYLLVPECGENQTKTSLLDVVCSYKDIISKEMVRVEGDLVEISRPEMLSQADMMVNLEVDRQKNRLLAVEGIAEAQQMAEAGNYAGATSMLSNRRLKLRSSAAGQAGDGVSMWLDAELKETAQRFGSSQMYQQAGRAYALSGLSSHAMQRASTRGNFVAGAAGGFGGGPAYFGSSAAPGAAAPQAAGYVTPMMANMVQKSQQQQSKKNDSVPEP